VLVGAIGSALGMIIVAALNRFAFGRDLSPGITPGPDGIGRAVIVALIIVAAMSALFAAAAGPKLLMRGEIDVLGRQRATFLAFLGANMMLVILALIGMKLGGMLAPILLIIGLIGYGPLALRLLGIPLGGSPVTPGAAAGGTPLGGAPLGGTPLGGTPLGGTPLGGAPLSGTPLGGTPLTSSPPPPPAPMAPRPPANLATPGAPPGQGLTPAVAPGAAAAAHWLIDFAVWADTLPGLLQRGRTQGQWGELAAERQRAQDFAGNMPDPGQDEIANAMRHISAALATMATAADPEALTQATLAIDGLRGRVIEDSRVRTFVSAHR